MAGLSGVGGDGSKEEDENEQEHEVDDDDEAGTTTAEGDQRVLRLGAGRAADEWLPEEGVGGSLDHRNDRAEGWLGFTSPHVNGASVFDKVLMKETSRRLV